MNRMEHLQMRHYKSQNHWYCEFLFDNIKMKRKKKHQKNKYIYIYI